MTDDAALAHARRFLHVCYCCSDDEPVTAFLVDGLRMRHTMSTPLERSGGAILGIDGEVESSAAFVFDARGPRTSPAVEVQRWVDPPLVGRPQTDVTAAGMQALGFSVPDLATAVDRLVGMGGEVVGAGRSPFDTDWTTLRDLTGVTLDLVAHAAVPEGETRMRHLRITCTDLRQSLSWYEGLGFEVLETVALEDASFLGLADAVDAVAVRLRLPDEAFEAVLVQWHDPASHGRHPAEPYHAGLFRAAVSVDDTRAAHDSMLAAGWSFDRAPMAVELKGTSVPDLWICFLSDPDGVPFEFVQRPRDAFRP